MIKNAINNIIQGNNLESILNETLESIFKNGPVSITDMEILSYFALYRRELLEDNIEKLLMYMGMYYKVPDAEPKSLKELVQNLYKETIHEKMNDYYTPVQACIVEGVSENKCYSFSAPTSTGKSYVFRNLIRSAEHDVVIYVPSRALINEYYLYLNEQIPEKTINILTFVDKLNTLKAHRNVFILTPERSSDLFKMRDEFNVDFFLFDEAQLGEEQSMRGLIFDSVVRRSSKYYPNAKLVFAQPFVSNPESQFGKNHLEAALVCANSFKQRSVGQIFYCLNKKSQTFYHFGINREVMGNKQQVMYDPIAMTLMSGGSVLFYESKSKIVRGKLKDEFQKYVDLCGDLDKDILKPYLDRLREYTGATSEQNRLYYSASLDLMKKGVVVHHGSMPLKIRSIMEDFIKAGHCRICFATSTIEQGINMPFDTIYIDRFEASKPLAIKNLIGRAGRTTMRKKLDIGRVVISLTNVTEFRKIITEEYALREESLIENPSEELGPDFNDFRQSIIDGSFVEEYNMTVNQLTKISEQDVQEKVSWLIETIIDDNNKIKKIYDYPEPVFNNIFKALIQIYESHLGRSTTETEKSVLTNALHILFYRMYFRTFSSICKIRYNHLCRTKIRRDLIARGRGDLAKKTKVAYMMGYSDIPSMKLRPFPLVDLDVLASDVDFDKVIYDTYDYLDKLIGFKLSDIYYAAFKMNYENTHNEKSLILANLIKYGTSDETEIMMIRYGLTFEDMKVLSGVIEEINTSGVKVNEAFYALPEEVRRPLERFV